jgi:DNA-binding NarL/FixJ family response regulator
MQPIKLLLISDNLAARRSLGLLFSAHGDFQIAGEIETAVSIARLQMLQPDVILYTPADMTDKSFDFIRTIKEICPCTITLVISNSDNGEDVCKALAAGVDGYLTPPLLPVDLVTAVELTCRSNICFLPRAARNTILDH